MTPITVDVATDTFVANLAACPFPAPSSFATLTLSKGSEIFFFFSIFNYLKKFRYLRDPFTKIAVKEFG